jgi:tRNA 2-thiouridine synthesizing protein A
MAFTGCWFLTSEIIDARGLKCPLPVLKLEKRLGTLEPGTDLTILATDPMAKIDIPLYCRQNGYDCVLSTDGPTLRFDITKAA